LLAVVVPPIMVTVVLAEFLAQLEL